MALDQKPGGSRTELPTDRGVDVGVAVILQSSDQTVLLTRRTCTLRISPNVWVPPGEHLGTDAVGDSVLSLHIATGCQSCTVDAQGLCPQLQTSSAHWMGRGWAPWWRQPPFTIGFVLAGGHMEVDEEVPSLPTQPRDL